MIFMDWNIVGTNLPDGPPINCSLRYGDTVGRGLAPAANTTKNKTTATNTICHAVPKNTTFQNMCTGGSKPPLRSYLWCGYKLQFTFPFVDTKRTPRWGVLLLDLKNLPFSDFPPEQSSAPIPSGPSASGYISRLQRPASAWRPGCPWCPCTCRTGTPLPSRRFG